MFWYSVIVAQAGNSTPFTYFYSEELERGQIVFVFVRKKRYIGIIVHKLENPGNIEKTKIKEIHEVTNFFLLEKHIFFIESVCYHTLNPLGSVVEALLQPLKDCSKKQSEALENASKQTKEHILRQSVNTMYQKTLKKINPVITIQREWLVRINIIIRRYRETQQGHSILIIVPEKIWIQKIQTSLENEFADTIKIFTYTGEKKALTRETYIHAVQLLNQKHVRVFLGTRSALFVPYSDLSQCILFDEANNLYHQDQNTLYYDAREVIFLLAHAYQTKLEFISRTVSIRINRMSSETLSPLRMYFDKENTKNLPKITLYNYNKKDSFFELMSTEILEDIGVQLEE